MAWGGEAPWGTYSSVDGFLCLDFRGRGRILAAFLRVLEKERVSGFGILYGVLRFWAGFILYVVFEVGW
jgi:hypothetical protein